MPIYLKSLDVLLLLLSIYGFALIFSSNKLYVTEGIVREVPNALYLKRIVTSLLPIYSFFFFTKKNLLSEKLLKKWIPVFIILVILKYFYARYTVYQEQGLTEFTNNVAYEFLCLIPIVLFFTKNNTTIIQMLSIFGCFIFIALGFKRGAIVISAICILIYLWVYIKNSSIRNKILTIIFSLIAIVGILYYFNFIIENSAYGTKRLEETQSGNLGHREDLYSYFWFYFKYNSGIIQQLFGNGAASTLQIFDNYAHNDWIEILINQGLIGVIIYAVYFVNFYRSVDKYRNTDIYLIILLIFVICLLRTFFSMSYAEMYIYTDALLGFIIANDNKYQIK